MKMMIHLERRKHILKQTITKRNKKEYLEQMPDWFQDFMKMKSKHGSKPYQIRAEKESQ